MDRSTIDKYVSGTQTLAQSVAGLTDSQLRWIPPANAGADVGKWTTQQVVAHIADGETAFVDRIKRIVAMDEPPLLAWDENKYAARLHYETQSVPDAVSIIELNRRQLANVLRVLPDADFQRVGVHSERGRQTLETVLGFAIWHLDHHRKFIDAKRSLMGK